MPDTTSHRPPKKVIKALQFDLPGAFDPLHHSSGAPLKLGYSFDASAIASLHLGYSGWVPFSETQKDAVRSALTEFAAVANVVLVEDNSGGDLDLCFGRTDIAPAGLGGFMSHSTGDRIDIDGYAIFDTQSPLGGRTGRHLILHEVGHGLTLKHSGNYGSGDVPPFLPKHQENNKYTVMSYRPNPDTGSVADHLMLYDIAALQARYGANLSYHDGDDVYAGAGGDLLAIWDAGGIDRIDGSAESGAVKIDLRDGRFSSLSAKDDVAIAYGVVIENATGGDGNNSLVGNKWANRLAGGDGDDMLDGGKGADRLDGGPGDDIFRFTASPGSGPDTMDDFAAGDRIKLDRGAFARLGHHGELAAGKFWVGSAAHDRSDRIVYDGDKGLLIYDQNGSRAGKAHVFAVLDPHLAIDHHDIIVA